MGESYFAFGAAEQVHLTYTLSCQKGALRKFLQIYYSGCSVVYMCMTTVLFAFRFTL